MTFLSNTLYGQQGWLEGTVRDRQNNKIAGAIVIVDKHNTVTGNDGSFRMSLNEGTYKTTCTFAGYTPSSGTVQIEQEKVTRLNFELEEITNPLDEIVVSTERYAQKLGEVTVSTDIIKPALILNKNITSLDQVMNQVPGVVVADGQASIRGGSGFSYGAGSRVLMLVDEIPMISADAGDIKWTYLPIENLEQVEVVKGASSVLYGSGALNGVANLRTAFARKEPRTQASIFYGSYDAPRHTFKWWQGSSQSQKGINFAHSQKLGNLDVVIGAHKFNDDGYRMFETESRDRFNSNLKYTFKKIPQLAIGANTNMMNARGGLFFLWQNYDSAYIPQGRNIQRYNNNRFNIDPWISWTGNADSARSYKVSLRNRYFKTENRNDKDQNSYAELYYSELQYSKNFARMNFTGGMVYMEQMVLGDSIYGQHRGRNIAGYAQLMRRLGKLTLTAGVRGEYYKVDSAETTGYLFNHPAGAKLPFQPVFRFGLNYHAAEFTYLRASFGQGYRFPSVAEKFVSTSVSTLKIFPNPSLQPERAYSAEISVKQGFNLGGFKGYADLATFYTRYYNMIEFVFDIYKPGGATGNLGTDFSWAGFKSQNVGQAEISGAEVGVNGAGMLGPLKLTLFSGYTYINPVQVGFNAQKDTLGLAGIKTLKYRNRHLFKSDIQVDYKRISIGYSARYQSKVENIDRRFVQSVLQEYSASTGINFSAIPSTYILPGLNENFGAFSKGFIVQDARISYNLSDMIRLSFIVNNLANVEYQNRPGDMRAPTMYVGQLLVKI